jgi:hypothetical protein
MKMKTRYLVSYRSQAFFAPALKAELPTGAVRGCALPGHHKSKSLALGRFLVY